MGPQDQQRRLAAIVSTDMVGYSCLMELDERGTIARQKAHRSELIDPKIAQHHGRIVKTTGDGLLVEFASVVDAVECAVAIQRAMVEREADVAEGLRIRYRVGINLGDIVIDDDDIYGDGVNIAARLQELADPCGVLISGTAYDQLKAKVEAGYEYLGEQQVKNIQTPVRIYRVLLDPERAGEVIEKTKKAQSRWIWATAAAALVVAIAGAGLWWQPWLEEPQATSRQPVAYPLPEKPSIAVLSFENLSGDPEQEYFADGMAEDIITDLAKISRLFVIARNSSFAYKGKQTDVRTIAAELGVKYVLEGSVRRAGDQVRINAQLVDAQTGGHLWAERYDGSLNDVFSLQDQVTQNIVTALAISLTAGEEADRAQLETASAEAYDAFLRGWAHYRRSTPDDFAKSVSYFEKAIELDPDYSRAYAALAAVYQTVADKNWSTGTSAWNVPLGVSNTEGLGLEQQYLQEAMKNPVLLAHQVASRRSTRQGQHQEAIAEAERAVASDPNDPLAHEAMGTALIYAGRPGEAPEHIRYAMRLDPQYSHEYLFWLGLAQFGTERFEDAVETLTQAARSHPDDDRSLIVLAASYGHLRKVPEAKAAIENANKLRSARQSALPDTPLELGADVFLVGPYTLKDVDFWPFKERADRERLREGLRLAGMPESGTGKQVSPLEVAGATTVDPAAAKALHDRGVRFVDVRGEDLWKNGHIPGAVNLDWKITFNEAALSKIIVKDQEVVIYCMGPRCLRSSKASAKAVGWGYQKVYYLRDGVPGWKAAGYAVEVVGDGRQGDATDLSCVEVLGC